MCKSITIGPVPIRTGIEEEFKWLKKSLPAVHRLKQSQQKSNVTICSTRSAGS